MRSRVSFRGTADSVAVVCANIDEVSEAAHAIDNSAASAGERWTRIIGGSLANLGEWALQNRVEIGSAYPGRETNAAKRRPLLAPKYVPRQHLRAKTGVPILNHMVQYSSTTLDATFSAVADPVRRGILERLGRGTTSITDLAEAFDMTLTGIKKHVHVLEAAGLVATEKVGRVRQCRVGPKRMEEEAMWIENYRAMLEARLNSLEDFLERTKGDTP